MPPANHDVAVIIPCHNEEAAIARVVDDFRLALPNANIFVYDNCSTDGTAITARIHGAVVRTEPRMGKGNVVRRMFADVEADIYILVDGDDTYDAFVAPELITALLSESVDMVSAVRQKVDDAAYRRGHRFGNWLLTGLVTYIFGNCSQDMLSGYRVMSRRFVKSFPAMSSEFEIETELTVHALQLRCPIAERRSAYKNRLPGSASKLSTFRDGFRILKTIGTLVKDELPLTFFGAIAALLALLATILSLPLAETYLNTHTVPRLPTAILVVGLMLVASLSVVCGLILSAVTRARNEMKRLHYLAQSIRIARP